MKLLEKYLTSDHVKSRFATPGKGADIEFFINPNSKELKECVLSYGYNSCRGIITIKGDLIIWSNPIIHPTALVVLKKADETKDYMKGILSPRFRSEDDEYIELHRNYITVEIFETRTPNLYSLETGESEYLDVKGYGEAYTLSRKFSEKLIKILQSIAKKMPYIKYGKNLISELKSVGLKFPAKAKKSVKEKFWTSSKANNEYTGTEFIEFFINPSMKELSECYTKYGSARGLLTRYGDIITWNNNNSLIHVWAASVLSEDEDTKDYMRTILNPKFYENTDNFLLDRGFLTIEISNETIMLGESEINEYTRSREDIFDSDFVNDFQHICEKVLDNNPRLVFEDDFIDRCRQFYGLDFTPPDKMEESYIDTSPKGVEFFVNPSQAELKECSGDGPLYYCRGFLTEDGDIIVWKSDKMMIHDEGVFALLDTEWGIKSINSLFRIPKNNDIIKYIQDYLSTWEDRKFLTIEIYKLKELALGESEDWSTGEYGPVKMDVVKAIQKAEDKNPRLEFTKSFYKTAKRIGLIKESSMIDFLVEN
jgi:hypothetical protein